MCTMSARHVVIAGGGVAALETVLALRDLAGDRVDVTLISDADTFVYRPLAVAEPFTPGAMHSYPLAAIADDFDVTLRFGRVTGASDRHALLADGDRVPFDDLVIAAGAQALPSLEGATSFAGRPT